MIRLPHEWNRWRIRNGLIGSDPADGANGFFVIPASMEHRSLDIIMSDGNLPEAELWEHVSIKVRVGPYTYTPTWDEMNWVKRQLWEPEDTVIQIHAPESKYVNCHPNVLHLWRHKQMQIHLPPSRLL
jgi:hypothetical protein